MHQRYKRLLITASLLWCANAQAVEFSGRFSVAGSVAQAKTGDVGYVEGDSHTLTVDQQSVRLMLDDSGTDDEWSLHLKTAREHLDGYPSRALSSSLFRYHELATNWVDEGSDSNSSRIGYEVDRALYKRRFDNMTLAVGRQPIDWGSGRFWQPLNIFGAFAPTDLNTDFKAGIDALVFDYYPSAFSSLTAAYVLKPQDNRELENSGALHYRRQVGEISELSLLAGGVSGNNVIGTAFESAWGGMGWRVEAAHYTLKETDEEFLFWIAGVDYQFEDGTLVIAEWYNNQRGAKSEADMGAMQDDLLVVYGLQQQLSSKVLGLSLARDITPLLNGSYTLLVAGLNEAQLTSSWLHQLTFTYSVSNESDLLFSLLLPNGKGMDSADQVRSEYGYLPTAMTLRYRFYF